MQLNTKLLLDDGRSIYPNYMDKAARKKLRDEIGNRRECMWCNCRKDTKLYYRISENLSFYPEHKNYEHAKYCSRYYDKATRCSAYVTEDDSNLSTVYLKFDPRNFTIPRSDNTPEDTEDVEDNEDIENIEDNEDENNSDLEKLEPDMEETTETEEELLPQAKKNLDKNKTELEFNIDDMVRCVNFDTFNERLIAGGRILTQEYFASALYRRLKNIKVAGTRKNLRDLTLEQDGYRFFYSKLSNIELKEEFGSVVCNVIVEGNDNNKYRLFTFSKIGQTKLKKFNKRYGELIEDDKSLMAAGFQYRKKSRQGRPYNVVGRLYLFKVNKYGILCRTNQEIQLYDALVDYYSLNKKDISLYLPVDDTTICAEIEVKGKERKLQFAFPALKNKPKPIVDDKEVKLIVIDNDMKLDINTIHRLVQNVDNENEVINENDNSPY